MAGSVRVLVALRVPVYVQPAQVRRSEQWKVSRAANGDLMAEVANTGNVHLKVGDLRLQGQGGEPLALVAPRGSAAVIFPGEQRVFRLAGASPTAVAVQVQTDQGLQTVALNDPAEPGNR